jgi:membrane-anchored protein YejM (alkaline phosphatase superfamily)
MLKDMDTKILGTMSTASVLLFMTSLLIVLIEMLGVVTNTTKMQIISNHEPVRVLCATLLVAGVIGIFVFSPLYIYRSLREKYTVDGKMMITYRRILERFRSDRIH